jgi:thioredoxin reductase
MPDSTDLYDAAVIGGGPAGLSAALTLGRAGRRTVLFDSGEYRNAPARHAHGILTRDGSAPLEIVQAGRDEVRGYGVSVVEARVDEARREGGVFSLGPEGRPDVRTRVLVVATGVVDELPEIPGVREAWGSGVVHCPYCHGDEHRGERTAVFGRGEATFHLARLLRGWTDDITVVTNGPEDLDEEMEARLEDEGIAIRRAPIERVLVEGEAVRGIRFDGGDVLECSVLYMQPPQRFSSPIAERLGARVNGDGRIDADPDGRTGVPGLFVAGDIVNRAQQVATAVGGGVWAGIAANHDLVCGPPEES